MSQTREEFEASYADKSGLTLNQLHELGGRGAPCDCDADNCRGWQMDFHWMPVTPNHGPTENETVPTRTAFVIIEGTVYRTNFTLAKLAE